MSDDDTITGGCACGTVRFEGKPPSLFCVHCHCRYCRTAHGAAFVTWLGLHEKSFSFTEGERAVTWYESSKQGRRGFCSKCGTTLFFASTLAPGEMHVALPCVDSTVDREPTAHVFDDQRVAWLASFADLPRIHGDAEALSKYSLVESKSD